MAVGHESCQGTRNERLALPTAAVWRHTGCRMQTSRRARTMTAEESAMSQGDAAMGPDRVAGRRRSADCSGAAGGPGTSGARGTPWRRFSEEVEAGRHATAARMLTAFLAERPGSDEAAYLLGTCEKAAGRDPRPPPKPGRGCRRARRSRRGQSSASWSWRSPAGGSPPPSNSSIGPCTIPASMRPPCPSTLGPSTG